MEVGGTTFESGIDIAASIAALSRVVKTGADLKFLDGIRIRERRVSQFSERIIGDGNTFDQVIVVVFASAVNVDVNLSAA